MPAIQFFLNIYKFFSFKVGSLCACHIDSYWYRGQIVTFNDQKYNVRLIDFGDLYELSEDDVTLLKPE